GQLVSTTVPPLGGNQLVGHTFRAHVNDYGMVNLRIASAVQATADLPTQDDFLHTMDPSGSTWLYDVMIDFGGGVSWEMCAPDRFGSRKAIPVAGWWDDTGALHDGGGRIFTFGCLSGVIAKCYKWSYLPW